MALRLIQVSKFQMDDYQSNFENNQAGPSRRASRQLSRSRERRSRILRSPSRSCSRERDRDVIPGRGTRSKSFIFNSGQRGFTSRRNNSEQRARGYLGEEHEQHPTLSYGDSPSDDEHEQRPRDLRNRGLRNQSGEFERRSYCRDRVRAYTGRDGEHERRPFFIRVSSRRDYDGEHERRLSHNEIRYSERSRSKRSLGALEHEEYATSHSKYLRETRESSRRSRSPLAPGGNGNKDTSANVLNHLIDALKKVSKSGSHNISSVTNVVPEFDPLSKTQTILSWLTKVEECADIYGWDERETIHYALPKLTGLAKTWYQSLPSVKHTWVQWKNKLIESFPCRENYAEVLTEMLNLKVKYGEPLEQYYYAKLNLLNRCQITGKKAVDCILFGIEDRAIKLGAQAATYDRPEQVLKYLKSVKVGHVKEGTSNITRSRIADRKPQNSQGNFNNKLTTGHNIKPPIKCFNCGTEGHPSFRCPKPLEKCNSCHRLGHQTASCPGIVTPKIPDPEKEKQVLKVALNKHDEVATDKYVVTSIINETPLECYVDLGSECTIIRHSDAIALGLKFSTDSLPLMRGLGGGLVEPIAKTVATIEIQDVTETIEILVVHDSILRCPLLLGHTFTERPGILISKTPSRLIFEKILDDTKLFLTVARDTIIESHAIKTVPVTCDRAYTGKVYVDGTVRGKTGSEFYLLSGEYELTKGEGNLLVQNISDKDVTFTVKSLISRALPVVRPRTVNNLTLCDDDDDIINHGNHLNEDQLKRLKCLLNEYNTCFSKSLNDLGYTTAGEMEIKLKDSEPVVYRPYRMSYAERLLVKGMVQDMIDADIVRESSSPYASPIVLVKKKTGEKRLCVDYRALNRKTVKDHYPLPRVEDQLDQLAGHDFFITLDLASGYYQIPIAEESIPKTAFVTPEGQFEYLRMPFGLVNAPSVFQRTVNKILADAKIKYAVIYMDDILIPAHNFEEGITRLHEVLELLKGGGLTLKLSKCHFFYNQIDFLGFEVGAEGVRPGSRKTDAVAKFPPPKNQHEVRQFMGLASFFRRFIRDFALIARPLTDLLRKNCAWIWEATQSKAFDTLKNALIERPVIALYDPSADIEVHTDACKYGVAGILMQKNKEGLLRPVSFYSRKTTNDEQKLHSFELETLAVIASLSRFRVYLVGVPFKIYTDCNALRTTLTKRDLVPRIARWWIQLQEYDCTIEYRAGKRMAHADALSRNPVDPAVPEAHVLDVLDIETDNWLSTAQTIDDEICSIKTILGSSDTEKVVEVHKNFKLKNDRVYRETTDGLRWVVPKAVRWQILKRNHDDIGHFGFDKTLSRIRETYWFPKMRRFVKKYVNSCLECAHHKATGGPKEGFLHSIPKVERPFHTVHADHLGPFVRSKRGNCYLLVIVDGFTKFVNITPVRNTKALTTIRVIRDHISYFGVPSRLITDRGACFTSQAFKKFIVGTGIKHILNAVATPRANGQVERFNRTILDALSTKSHGQDDRTWDEHVPEIQIGLNTTVHKATQKSPSELLFGFRTINTSESIMNDVIDDTLNVIPSEKIAEMRQDAGDRIKARQEKERERFNRKRKTPHVYKEGDLVRVEREIGSNDGKSKKLLARYQGPYRILKILPNDRFVIEDTPITRKRNTRYEAIVAVDKLRPWFNLTTDLQSSSEGEEQCDDDEAD